MRNTDDITLRITYDNFTFMPKLIPDHGFSCVIDIGDVRVLFDTGANGDILLNNLEALNINPKTISTIVISHSHNDHVGGLDRFLEVNSDVNVYILASFPEKIKRKILGYNVNLFETISGIKEISNNLYLTGELRSDDINEQSLVIETERGLVILTGCAHPGIVNILNFVKNNFKKRIYLLAGGFHLLDKSEQQLVGICEKLRELEVERIMPCHCSGELAVEIFKREFEGVEKCGVGKVLNL